MPNACARYASFHSLKQKLYILRQVECRYGFIETFFNMVEFAVHQI